MWTFTSHNRKGKMSEVRKTLETLENIFFFMLSANITEWRPEGSILVWPQPSQESPTIMFIF